MYDLERLSEALEATPTAAYSAPHDYPNAARMFQRRPMTQRPPQQSPQLRLYVHIPFCNYACSFCCYAKKVGASTAQKQRYVAALERELEWVKPGTPVSQFFIGGGTPTALPAQLLDRVLAAIGTRMPYVDNTVHTVETSPESASDEHLKVLAARGVGRLSMGIQSLAEGVLDTVWRGHGPQTALESCQRIVAAGFILNIDLIYGLPGQSAESFRRDFAQVAAAGVHAVTAYSLRLNSQTPVARALDGSERFDLAGLLRWRSLVRDTAFEHGYTQTRWHTFKRMDGIARRHQRLPTADADLQGYQFGIGMSARSTLGHMLYRNHSVIGRYLERIEADQSPVEEVIPLRLEDRKTQYISRTLGDGQGLQGFDYGNCFGTALQEDFGPVLARLQTGGLLESAGEDWQLTETGRLLYDLVMLSFYPTDAQAWLRQSLGNYELKDRVAGMAA